VRPSQLKKLPRAEADASRTTSLSQADSHGTGSYLQGHYVPVRYEILCASSALRLGFG